MEPSRYHRQMIFPAIGEEGQRRLLAATAVIVGCGATGSMLAILLARAGVGRLRIVDRDIVEAHNLQRQMLFDEDDVALSLPKAEAAARRLRRMNSDITIEAVVADVSAGNVLSLIEDATVVLDGTDNFTTRYLLNDACIYSAKPWVYCGVIASYGMTATFVPDEAPFALPGKRDATGCLRCLLGDIPAPGSTPGCDTAGVIGPAVSLISSIAAAEAIKLIVGEGELNRGLLHVDLWTHDYDLLGGGVRDPQCRTCAQRQFEFLGADVGAVSATLCGRNAVQVRVQGAPAIDLDLLASRLRPVASHLARNDYLLRARVEGYDLTVFPDNRALVEGTDDEALARSIYDRYIGS